MKSLLTTIVLALAATACVKQGQVREVRQPVELRSICHDAKFSDVCAPSSNEMPTVIDINLAVPSVRNSNLG